MNRKHIKNIVAILLFTLLFGVAHAEDWPTYMRDAARTGVSTETVTLGDLNSSWTYTSPVPPQVAWCGGAPWDAWRSSSEASVHIQTPTRNFDFAFPVTIVGDYLYFGSSVTNSVHCVEAATGVEQWAFTTNGPVRYPPTYDNNKLYFGSDDGFAYCINAADGSLAWKYSPGGDTGLIANNNNLITMWPIRTGTAVLNGKVYFAASMVNWKSSYLCSLDAATGSDSGAGLYKVSGGYTPQGAILASSSKVYLTQGRLSPYVFNLLNGSQAGTLNSSGSGGCYALLAGGSYHYGHQTASSSSYTVNEYGAEALDSIASYNDGRTIVVIGTTAYVHTETALSAINRDNSNTIWSVPSTRCASLIAVGNYLFAGGQDDVAAYHITDGSVDWSQAADGTVRGLAFSGGKLFVSTDTGSITMFGLDTVSDFKVTPGVGFSSLGEEGGPFSPISSTFTLENTTDSPLNWTASKTQTWLDLSATSGTIAAQSSATVDATINSNANGLTAGSYNDTVVFTDTTNTIVEQRTVVLDVTTSLYAHWKFDETSGSNAADSSVNSSDGAVDGAAWTTGLDNNALSFDGSNDVVTFGTGPSLGGQTDFTLSAWIKTSATTDGVIIQQRDVAGWNGEYVVSVAADGTVHFMLYGNSAYQYDFGTTATVNNGAWHHIVVIRDGEDGYIYIDAAAPTTTTGTLRDLDATIGVGIGADIRDNGSYFNGLIDDVRIYNEALSSTDISALYDAFMTADTTAPTPDPMTWATVPYSMGSTSISMTATTATDASSVEYYFTCTAGGGNDSGWQDSTTYENTALTANTSYTYTVEARDKSAGQNETAASSGQSATTDSVSAPGQATSPSPTDANQRVDKNADLSWTAGTGATSHDVYFGTDSTPDASEFIGNQTTAAYDPGTMGKKVWYYWRIDEVNGGGTTTGVVWSFETK